MKFEFHIYHHYDPNVFYVLNKILQVVNEIKEKGGVLLMKLDELKVQVESNTAIEQSAIILIQGIAAQLAEIATDPSKVQELADQLRASAVALAAAVSANTVPA